MVTTKKMSIEYAQMEMRRESSKLSQNKMKQWNTKDYSKRGKEWQKSYKVCRKHFLKMSTVSPSLSLITLNENGLNSTIKRHRLPQWLKKQDPTECCL